MPMIHYDFPDLQWLKRQIHQGFVEQRALAGNSLPAKGWPSIILQVNTSEVFRDNIKGPFSLFGNLSGQSHVRVENRKVKIGTDQFFISNAQQEYTLEVDKSGAETFNIHFGEAFAEGIISSYQKDIHHLLSDKSLGSRFRFHNRLIPKTEGIQSLIKQLQKSEEPIRKEELLAELFLLLFQDQIKLYQKEEDLPSIKQSTRTELIKRLLLSTDYIHCHYHHAIDLEELATISCLSKFHFLRLFKMVFQLTPHQYITEIRLQRAQELLMSNRTLEIHQISKQVGFQDSSSFSRSFYQHVGVYPSQFRA